MEQLGINSSQLLIQIANFALLVFLLQKFLYTPILKKLDERNAKITQALAQQEHLEKLTAALAEKEKALLKKAKEEAQSYLSEAKKDAAVQREKLLKDAKAESQSLLTKLETQQAAVLENMKQELTSKTASIATEMVRSVLSTSFSEADHHTLIQNALSKLKKS